ncbi:alpha/beta hydrolase-fold protein [Tahibacter soli]|jgi:predicted esterase|uniref:PHB depolymerase family esterase n=1 Tax=Tahibacter soli TaxID=2983605 RepID=A0A9X3YKU4_9GAMM|nr:PHB depolymerase family esterase [Tahibacter soli]MDC8013474.1 PHB depolymerase family esterase [Tahibacter soli]
MNLRRLLAAAALAVSAAQAHAATTVRLAPWACDTLADRILRSGFDTGEAIPTAPSNGSGGAGPGSVSLYYTIPDVGTGSQAAHLYIPPRYTPARAWPVIVVLHGAAGSAFWADQEALRARGSWQDIGYLYGAIVVAPVANGSNGSWVEPVGSSTYDYGYIASVLDDVAAQYNVDRARIYLWGFSAGGHVAHDLVMNGEAPNLDRNHVAAYAASAGRLFGAACKGLTETGCANLLAAQPRKPPFDLHLGDTDPMGAPPYDADLDIGRLQNAGWVPGDTLSYVTFSGGHDYTPAHAAQIWSFVCRFATAP